ncbi:hypothetical protein [uncultured Ruegeria sp.]|uniref:hypothetical protein n=1 Tax=uncultured Ruegeria sp. TaxID=259304 RepID=UPI002628CF86|nr:hypothetical protein [uncultured Ruegeria sp.]
MKDRLPGLLATALFLVGCAPPIPSMNRSDYNLTPVQACAIGFDMARTIHKTISLRKTVVIAPGRSNSCETHTLNYLRLAGFAVDESGRGDARTALDVAVTHGENGEITALATVAGDLRIARRYRLANQGVYAASAPSIIHLPPEYRRKGAGLPRMPTFRRKST